MSGLISAAVTRLRASLASLAGPGLIGYSASENYPANTMGAGLKAEAAARASLAGDVAAIDADVNALQGQVATNATTAANNTAAVQANVDAITAALAVLIKPGFSIEHCGPLTEDPEGWFIEDGRQLNVADEPALFAAIGYTWGGSGAVFNIPDTRDDFTRGASATRPVGTREADAFQGHEHGYVEPNQAGGGGYAGAGTGSIFQVTDSIEQKAGFSAPRVADETRPRNVAKFKLIKR